MKEDIAKRIPEQTRFSWQFNRGKTHYIDKENIT